MLTMYTVLGGLTCRLVLLYPIVGEVSSRMKQGAFESFCLHFWEQNAGAGDTYMLVLHALK